MSTEQTPFEAEFGLKPLGDDTETRIARLEAVAGTILRAIIKNEGRDTLRGMSIAIPSRYVVEQALDDFREPKKAEERRRWAIAQIDA